MKNFYLVILLAHLFLVFTSCNKDEGIDSSPPLVINPENEVDFVIQDLPFGISLSNPLDLIGDSTSYLGISSLYYFDSISGTFGNLLTVQILDERCKILGKNYKDTLIVYKVFDDLGELEYSVAEFTSEMTSTIPNDHIWDRFFVEKIIPTRFEEGDVIDFEGEYTYTDKYGILYQRRPANRNSSLYGFVKDEWSIGEWLPSSTNEKYYLQYKIEKPNKTYFGWIEMEITLERLKVSKTGYHVF